MACLEHYCTACGHTWFDNERTHFCELCGERVTNVYDEDDFDIDRDYGDESDFADDWEDYTDDDWAV